MICCMRHFDWNYIEMELYKTNHFLLPQPSVISQKLFGHDSVQAKIIIEFFGNESIINNKA